MKFLLGCILFHAALLSHLAAENEGPTKYKLEPASTRRALRNSRAGVAGVGAWGGWGPWSACSRSCGGGVAVQARECRPEGTHLRSRRGRGRRRRVPALGVVEVPAIVVNAPVDSAPLSNTPPALATRRCEGLDKRYHECNTKPCPGPEVDKRAEQCAAFDRRPFKGRFYSWLPYVDAESPCTLNCRPHGQQFYASLALAADGTECTRPGYRAICVHGECKVVGRDGVLAAGTRGGSVAECGSRLVSGLFSRPKLHLGYTLIATVPAGACRLNISELQPSENYIDKETYKFQPYLKGGQFSCLYKEVVTHPALKVSNGSFVINGAFALSAAGAYEAAGARFVYARGGGTESVYAAGPLLHSIDIMILYKDPNPIIKYEYLTSAETPQAESSVSTHAHRHQHVPGVSDVPRVSHVSDVPRVSHVSHEPNVPLTSHEPYARDNTIAGSADTYSWKMMGFSPCSRTCGGGVQTSRSRCESSRGTPAPAAQCSPASAPRARRRRCGSAPCAGGARWRTGPWSAPCPECGPYLRTRQVVCVQEHNRQVTKISEHKCTDTKPHLSEKCPVTDCVNATTTATPPDAPVADDRRRLRPRGRDTDDFRDAPRSPVLTRPEPRDRDSSRTVSPARNREFNRAETSNDVGALPARDVTIASADQSAGGWIFTEWSTQCTSECGRGLQTRAVSCASRTTSPDTDTPADCAAGARPPSARSCASDARCDLHQWFTGPWSVCSSPCGSSGRQTRAVVCVSGGGGDSATPTLAATSACARDPRPATERPCVSQAVCDPVWYTGDWTECSGSCGAAQESRAVRCALEGGVLARDRLCVEPRPAARRACTPAHCLTRAQHHQRPGGELNDTGPGGARSTDVQDDQSATADSSCVDRFSSCSLAVQARLCQYNYYRTACCRSCAAPHPYKIAEVN